MNRSAEPPLLECRALECGYPGRSVLSAIELSIASGTSTVILGPNGSGKSTLLRTLSGTLPLINGRILISGKRHNSLSASEIARHVAYVPQEELPPFRFTVRQVVMMGRLPVAPGFFDSPADHRAAEEAMTQAGCLELAERPITEVSGGERQCALIARALAQETPLLLLDEPTSHLDVSHQIAIVRLVRKLKEEGRGMLIAVHDLNLAGELGDSALLLSGGTAALTGAIEDVLSSDKLEQAYGVEFQRFRDDTGRLRLFPRA